MLMSRNTPSPNLPVGFPGQFGEGFLFRAPPARVFVPGLNDPAARAGAVLYFAIQ